jgi:serine protease Do
MKIPTRMLCMLCIFLGLPARVSQAFTVEQVKALEAKVKKLVAKNTPAVVALVNEKNSGSGSGVIVSPDGLILTAGHVTIGCDEMVVVFPNGNRSRCKVLGADYGRDLSLAKMLKPGAYPFAEVGDSQKLEATSIVVSLGHPGGFDLRRTPPVRIGRIIVKNSRGFLASDSTVVFGDSGGPLFDLEGMVVGIHSHISQSVSMNLDAPVSAAKASWDRMLEGKRFGKLGTLDGADAEQVLRDLLEKQGVPKEELQGLKIADLQKRVKDMNIRSLMDEKDQKKLADQLDELIAGHAKGAAAAEFATFALRDGKRPRSPLARAAGVHAAGWLITKASEVMDAAELQCEIKGAWLPVDVVRVWEDHDLALIKVDAKDIPAVNWAAGPAPEVGAFIVAVSPAGSKPAALGVVSVATRSLQTRGQGFLGVTLDNDETGFKVRDVIAGTAALRAGVQKNDRIIELDGNKPDSVVAFARAIASHKAGENVQVKLQRGGETQTKDIQLADRGSQSGIFRPGAGGRFSLGSKVNRRMGDFPNVIQTDLTLSSHHVGSPVTDLDGNVIGIVIARSGRVETMVIPSETIRHLLSAVNFNKEGNPPPKPVSAPAGN